MSAENKIPLKMKMTTLTLLTCQKLTRKSVLSGGKYLMIVGRLEVAVNLIIRHSLLSSSTSQSRSIT